MKGSRHQRPFIHYLALYGCISTGIIYLAVGTLAILSFLQIRDGGADESSMLAILNNSIIGYIFVWIILLGTLSYIAWRVYETLRDPYGYGKDAKGITTRTGIGMSILPDMLLAYSAFTAVLGTSTANENGRPEALRESVTGMLNESWGEAFITGTGIAILITAALQAAYGIIKGYRERLDIDHLGRWVRNGIYAIGLAGYISRGIILGIIGYFFFKAGRSGNAQHVVNTDKAFDFIGDNTGHAAFILIAIGTICYGLFMCVFGVYYDTDKDKD